MSNLRALASLGSSLVVFGCILAMQSFAGCSSSPTPSGSPCSSDTDCDGDATCVDGQCVTASGGSSSSGSSGSVQLPPACYKTCTTAADCGIGNNSPVTDADNWNCNAGTCEYKGCNSDQECIDASATPEVACVQSVNTTVKVCRQTCTTVMDCPSANAPPLLDVDNWTCSGGVCEFMGCNSTQECTDSLKDPNYACADYPGTTVKLCTKTCTSSMDCIMGDSPTTDADNYNCNAGICEYKGCNSTQECTDAQMDPNYVCK